MHFQVHFFFIATKTKSFFLIHVGHLNMILSTKKNWTVLVSSTIFIFHRHLGLATMFGMDSIWAHQFTGKERLLVLFSTFVLSIVPLGILIRNRPAGAYLHDKDQTGK